ncbi:1,6-dihydroxycyclohexa-2,4-diene-1-carboxylate dehydrogenase [Geodia barretti]|uniref:1,6-dihydroxycyclohexa-2,4-diene-1-carboxylate dehydrogenase n=1 Tax=Geodia barretti TaxID=519541 RepID=A0AA35TIR4_GEOBA|nr:1,6-dihydroxycyclohexa-2,4-diene-1-carboxylate dehydrogenase [Geodia barretti]
MAGELDPRAAGARRFDGQVAVITGGGQGIGSATARRLAQEGASIVIGDMVAETSDRVCAAIREFGGECVISLGDLSRWENAEALMRRAMETYGRIDVLANIAGGTIWFQSFQYYTPEQIQAEMDRSFWTAMWCCRATLPHMIQQGSGSIVNIATHAVTGRFRVPYAAAKAGQIGMTTSLAREVAHLGIRVNCIAPSGTAADHGVEVAVPELPESERVDQQQYRASTRSSEIPMGRRGEADEQAAAIAFLASHDASYITGQVLAVGGGQPYPF